MLDPKLHGWLIAELERTNLHISSGGLSEMLNWYDGRRDTLLDILEKFDEDELN